MKGSERLRALIFCLVTLTAACKGPTGPQGLQGVQGTQGTQGQPGDANVQYSPWFTPAAWTVDTIFGVFNFNYVRVDSSITQAVLDSGAVLVFGKLDGYTPAIWPADQVAKLPIVVTYMLSSTMYTDTWSGLATPDTLRLNFVNNQNLYGSISNAHKFRYVIIPGGVALSASSERVGRRGAIAQRYTRQQLQTMPYEQVARLFHIPLD